MNRHQMLQECVESLVNSFLFDPTIEHENLYNHMLKKLEKPLVRATLQFYMYNQTKTAKILGLNRGTLRKKMKKYQLKSGGIL